MDTSFIAYLIFGLFVIGYTVYQYVDNRKKKGKVYQLASPVFLMVAALAVCVVIIFTLVHFGVVK